MGHRTPEATTPTVPEPVGWGRRRLIGILTAAAAVLVLLIGGLVYAVHAAVTGVGDTASGTSNGGGVATGTTQAPARVARGAGHRAGIVSEPMLTVSEDAAFPAETTPQDAPAIEIPEGGQVAGPGFVMTGFPRTPEGAIGQLAQIDLAVLQTMSVGVAGEVYRAWALPGGVGAEDWWITTSVKAFLSSTGMGEQGMDPTASVTLVPAAALVKGTDGPDWATVCVLYRVTATYQSVGEIAFAHCEPMQWIEGRWMLAPGAPPAPAPATWPGTALALDAGWRTWTPTPTTPAISGGER
ncbi:MAG: hypothetical protein ACRCYU_10755 [Nocardioides sp.]